MLTKCGVQGMIVCSIIRTSLTVALMVSLPSQISAFCALTARSPCICSHLRVALDLCPTARRLMLSSAPAGAFLRALRASEGRKKRGFLQKPRGVTV